jgi:hypothetical protein
MEEMTLLEDNYFILPDTFSNNNRKYEHHIDYDVDYDVESNILRVSPEKKGKKERENIIVNKNGYKYLLIANILLTIQFLFFLSYFVKMTHPVKNTEPLTTMNVRRLRTDNSFNSFINMHHKEIINSKKKTNRLTMKVMKLFKPLYIDSLKSKRLVKVLVKREIFFEK